MKNRLISQNEKYKIILLLNLCLISACNDSKLSKGKVEDISLLQATINITQDFDDKNKNETRVYLNDENLNSIENDSISVFINNKEGTFENSDGFYSRPANYYFLNLPINQKYKVEIKLTNGQKYFLGEIKALKEVNINDIKCLEKVGYNKDISIEWTNLQDIDELSLAPVFSLPKNEQEIDAGLSDKNKIITTIQKDGKYTYPKSKFKVENYTIEGLEVIFRTTKTGKVNPKLIKNSQITITSSIDKWINFQK